MNERTKQQIRHSVLWMVCERVAGERCREERPEEEPSPEPVCGECNACLARVAIHPRLLDIMAAPEGVPWKGT